MAVRHVYSLAMQILNTTGTRLWTFKHQPTSALQWLHSLCDGEIDVDRADYLRGTAKLLVSILPSTTRPPSGKSGSHQNCKNSAT